MPLEMTLTEWLQDNENALRQDPHLRDKNGVVACQLLPIFEEFPAAWNAVPRLPVGRATRDIPEHVME